ncbi:low molecular weight protein-tyrosine-phosphatase [Treponema pectinovorum]|uniref:low molecular weight protein-tyrosine-phosphatase n=1 Tax=Treponema pectinovorum TaxID=164 RepID=UPI0011C6EC0C|nr:low molecular weight protein-tyrosine-phosphatase [Treponema pectinovorum]
MRKILFVCHGNICRSPMAEMVMKHLVKMSGLQKEFFIESAACRRDEIGSPIHRGTVSVLKEKGIEFTDHRAVLVKKDDFSFYDLIIAMDEENIRDLTRLADKDERHKIHKMLEYTGQSRDVADPWYTGNFEETWNDIYSGCKALLESLKR